MATQHSTRRRPRFIDLTGQQFGRWTVLEFHSIAKGRCARWLCRCECGAEKPVYAMSLRNGRSQSCLKCAKTKHGMKGTSEWRTWSAMRGRCNSPTHKAYPNYGGRGITVCDEWQFFGVFLEDMGKRPSNKHSLDRIDNDLGYSKENCRWATREEQGRNKRTNRMLTYDDKTMCVAAWAKEVGISKDALYGRLNRGWSVERALTTSVQVCKH